MRWIWWIGCAFNQLAALIRDQTHVQMYRIPYVFIQVSCCLWQCLFTWFIFQPALANPYYRKKDPCGALLLSAFTIAICIDMVEGQKCSPLARALQSVLLVLLVYRIQDSGMLFVWTDLCLVLRLMFALFISACLCHWLFFMPPTCWVQSSFVRFLGRAATLYLYVFCFF